MFRHPKYYEELRKIRKQFLKEQAAKSTSQQADKPASEQAIEETVPHNDIEEANKPTSAQADKSASAQASGGSRTNKRSI